ncbi:hypothetical protein [Paenibacillus sp. ISL-20]|uniref:hypothetical protein n=1 Tax=Paenibacillus sp. ISL-20 TaxID=2819163 RepID=UPI001BE8687E|nr:hypothetical protein [Paenibacillus sp. ISL-20]
MKFIKGVISFEESIMTVVEADKLNKDIDRIGETSKPPCTKVQGGLEIENDRMFSL